MAILSMIFHHYFSGYAVTIDIEAHKNSDALFILFERFAPQFKLCVGMFAFITGYGFHYIIKHETKPILHATLNRLNKFYFFFCFMSWLIFLLINTFPCGAQCSFPELALLLIGYKSCISDYWYISVVLMSILLFFPVLLLGYRKGNSIHTGTCLALLILNMLVAVLNPFPIGLWHVATLIMPFFMLGYVLNWTNSEKMSAAKSATYMLITLFFSYFGYSYKWGICILACAYFVNCKFVKTSFLGKMLAYLGTYSMCMWLNHRLIFGYWAADYIYSIPTPFDYILVVAISLGLSIILTKAYDSIYRKTSRFFKSFMA